MREATFFGDEVGVEGGGEKSKYVARPFHCDATERKKLFGGSSAILNAWKRLENDKCSPRRRTTSPSARARRS
jgi:hypothetical protein